METVLVTGGTGYIGSHTVVELIQCGYRVVIADNLSNSSTECLHGIERITGVRPHFVRADCSDREQMAALFGAHPDMGAIIHFAALKAVGESVGKPLEYYRNNVVSVINLLDQLRARGGGHLVFSGSCTVYGQPDELPVTERAPLKPALSPYGNTKRVAEEIIRDALRAMPQARGISLRYFNPVGAHPSALIGELPLGTPDNLVPFITQTAAGIREQLLVFGNDYSTPDGTPIRDYFHVTDLAKAHVLALERLRAGRNREPFEVFNVGAGRGVSVLEIIQTFERATGVQLNYRIVGRRPGDIERVWADTTLAAAELGWRAECSLEEALRAAWRWEQRLRGLGG